MKYSEFCEIMDEKTKGMTYEQKVEFLKPTRKENIEALKGLIAFSILAVSIIYLTSL